MIVPGIQRADGKEGRKFYLDPPPDPKNPGFTDFLHDEDQLGALWPARFYDGEWDKYITKDDTLRSLVDAEINATILDWTSLFWGLLRKWNVLVNSLGDYDTTSLILLLVIFIGILYNISSYFGAKPHPKYTLYTIIGGITLFYIFKQIVKARKENTMKDPGYMGRELANPYSKSFNFLYQLDKGKDVCPYGCVHDKTITMDASNHLTGANKCKDTRSVFAFGGSLDPDPYTRNADPKLWKSSTSGGYMCPPKEEYNGYPYSWLCKDQKPKCLGSTIHDKTIKVKADEICSQYHSKHDLCHSYSQAVGDNKGQLLLKKAGDKPIEIQCHEVSDPDTSCPFPRAPQSIAGKSDIEQRRPVKVWTTLYDKIAGKDKRVVSKDKKIEWQNQLRYEIVDQNYTKDKLYGSP